MSTTDATESLKGLKQERESELFDALACYFHDSALLIIAEKGTKLEMDIAIGVSRRDVVIKALREAADRLQLGD